MTLRLGLERGLLASPNHSEVNMHNTLACVACATNLSLFSCVQAHGIRINFSRSSLCVFKDSTYYHIECWMNVSVVAFTAQDGVVMVPRSESSKFSSLLQPQLICRTPHTLRLVICDPPDGKAPAGEDSLSPYDAKCLESRRVPSQEVDPLHLRNQDVSPLQTLLAAALLGHRLTAE